MTPKTRKFIKLALKLLISGGLLYIVFINVDLESLFLLMKRSNPLLLVLATLFFIVSKILSAYRLNVFQKESRIYLRDSVNLKLYWLGMYYNMFLPGGIGGDGYKIYYLKKHRKVSFRKLVLVMLFDRVTGVISLVFMILLLSIFIPESGLNIYILAVAAVLIVAIFYLTVRMKFRSYFRHLNRTNLQSLGVQISQMICAFLILRALAEDHNTLTYLVIFLVSSLAAVIPLTIGGIGLREMAFLYAAKLFNLNVTVSLSLSLLFFLITAIVSLAAFPLSIQSNLIEGKASD